MYTDRGTQFTSKFWKELWGLFGTQLRYSTAYHPQTQGIVEWMNAVIGQMIRCTLSQMNDVKNWVDILPTVELAINSLPNRSTGYSPFFLNYGYHPTVPSDLLCGGEVTNNETVGKFRERMIVVWELAYKNIKKAIDVQSKYYDARHRMVSYSVGDLILLNTVNLHLKGILGKLKKKFIGPFKIIEKIGLQSYRVELPESYKIHNVFHVSLLKFWNESQVFARAQQF